MVSITAPKNLGLFKLALPHCKHEAGHYVAGRALGFVTKGIAMTIQNKNGHSGGAEVELEPLIVSTDALIDYLERRVQVLYAGATVRRCRTDRSMRRPL